MKFNADQLTAIRAGSGYWQVLAGPGSGKTAVLAARYQLLRSLGFDPLCITFTKAAAEEMKARAGGGNFRTIQSAAYQILKDGARGSFVAPPLDQLVSSASECLEHLREGVYLFDSLMVDESQDCSELDWRFIRLLSPNIFAVGDAMQCIHAFRGSQPDVFLNMPDQFPGCRTLFLGQNYRSTQKIVEFCKQIAPVRGALLEKLCSNNEPGDPVEVVHGLKHNVDEAEFIITQATYKYPAGSSVVLARTNRQLRIFQGLGAPPHLELSTIHASKGREWDNVYVVGVQQGLLPYKDGDVDEESRLLFVAASRAKKRLTLTSYGTSTLGVTR